MNSHALIQKKIISKTQTADNQFEVSIKHL